MSTEEYIENMRTGKSKLEKTIQKIHTDKADELEATRAELEIEKLKAEINRVKGEGQPLRQGVAADFTGRIMELAQVDPDKAQSFIKGLTKEDLDKIAFLMAAESDRAGAVVRLAQSSGTSVKDLVEIVKLMRPANGSTDLKGVAEVFKLGLEAGKSNVPEPKSTTEAFKEVMGFVQPFIDALQDKDRQNFDLKIKALEDKMPAPLSSQIEHYKEMAKTLGLTEKAGKSSELDLKLEEMRQSHDLDMERITWEQKKYLLQQDADRDKWTAIQQTLSPIFQMNAPAIQNAIRSVAKDVGKSITQQTPNPPPQSQVQPTIAPFTCPKCNTELSVPIPPNAPETIPIKCPKCGEITSAAVNTEEQPPPEEPSRQQGLRPTWT